MIFYSTSFSQEQAKWTFLNIIQEPVLKHLSNPLAASAKPSALPIAIEVYFLPYFLQIVSILPLGSKPGAEVKKTGFLALASTDINS